MPKIYIKKTNKISIRYEKNPIYSFQLEDKWTISKRFDLINTS